MRTDRAQDAGVDLPTELSLYPFQREDVEYLYPRRSVLIANEMGTGKTYEAIALDYLRRKDFWESDTVSEKQKPLTLVVAPLSVVDVWKRHYTELMPSLKLSVMDPKNRGAFLYDLRNYEADVYILHWEGMRIIHKELQGVWFLHVIADEAHRAKNRKAQQTRALKSLKATYKTALTGTPVMNQPQDLWSILNWLYPSEWGSYWRFFEKYVDYELVYPQQYRKVVGPKNVEHLQARIKPFYVRRLKKDVLGDLPDKYYTSIYVDLDPKQRRAYDQMRREMIAWLETVEGTEPLVAPVVIAQLTRLQQLASAYVTFEDQSDGTRAARLAEPSTKVDALMEILEDNPDEPIVVFSRFRQLIGLVERRLEKRNIRYVRITGDDPDGDRRKAVEDFQAGRVRIFLGTIGAGSEGITLTASSTVVFLDRDWTPARNAQAEDRLHRIGQEEAVQVIDIIARDTVDLGHHQKLELKKEWIRQILGD